MDAIFRFKKIIEWPVADTRATKFTLEKFSAVAIDESGIDENVNHGRQCIIEICIRHLALSADADDPLNDEK